jgi:hypothetical protein
MENDIIIASDIGAKIKEKIDDHMKYLNPYWDFKHDFLFTVVYCIKDYDLI